MRGIALFKLVKAGLAVGAAVAAWELVAPATAEFLQSWAHALPLGVLSRLAQRGLAALSGIPAQRWRELGFMSILYAGIFTLEGIGLWLERGWAEYLTIATTGSLLPFEALEVAARPTAGHVAVLLVNLVVLLYLIALVRRQRRARS